MLQPLHTNHNDVLLQLLRRRRVSKRLRQADLADRLGRGQSAVSKIERGVLRLDVIELREWLKALGVDFLDFMKEFDSRLEHLPAVDPRFRPRKRRPRLPSSHAS